MVISSRWGPSLGYSVLLSIVPRPVTPQKTPSQITWLLASSGRPQVLAGPRDCAGRGKAGSRTRLNTVWSRGGTLLGPSRPSSVPRWGCGCPFRAWLLPHGRGVGCRGHNGGQHLLVSLTEGGLCSGRHVRAGPREFLLLVEGKGRENPSGPRSAWASQRNPSHPAQTFGHS